MLTPNDVSSGAALFYWVGALFVNIGSGVVFGGGSCIIVTGVSLMVFAVVRTR